MVGGHGPWERPTSIHRGDGSWRASRYPGGPATLHVRREGATLLATAWGPGARDALATVPAAIGLDDDGGGWRCVHRRVRDLRAVYRGVRVGAGRPLLEVLVPVVVAQRVTHQEARDGYRRLVQALGEPAPGPLADLWLPPEAGALRSLPEHGFHRFGIEAGRARTLRALAGRSGWLDRIATLPPEEAFFRLVVLPGIGPWTAAIAVARSLGWRDAVPLGDVHLPRLVAATLDGGHGADDARMVALLEPYAGHRWRILQLITAVQARARPP